MKREELKKISDLKELTANIDAWIRDFNEELSKLKDCPALLEEVSSNADYNFELIKELKQEVNNLKLDIKGLKSAVLLLMQSHLVELEALAGSKDRLAEVKSRISDRFRQVREERRET